MNLHVTQGRLQNLDNHGIAVVDTLASTNGWKLGDTIDVRFALTGTRKLTLAAIFTDKIQARPLIIALPTYQANVADQFDTRIYVQAAADTSTGQARAALQNATAGYPTAKVDSREQYISTQLTQINQILSLIYLLLAFAVMIALMGITNTLALSIFERTRELGLLRAVGMTRRQLRATIRYESIIIALLGTTLGLLIGLGFGWGLVHAMSDQGIHHLTIPFAQLGIITVIAALAGVTAAALPAHRASRLDPLQAIATT
jgi:putative ABC transport system permease protein